MSFKIQVLRFKLSGALAVFLVFCSAAPADDFAALCADRAAIERVYYQHRLGEKPPFEQALPAATLENLVRQDLRKEAALKKNYGLEITPALLDAEVQRINTTTRAPEMLAELKAALGNDPARFARAMARPIVVERTLRARFENDDALHAPPRREAERVRNGLFAARKSGAGFDDLLPLLKRNHSNEVSEATWQLGARPEEKPGAESADELEIKKRFGPNAQMLSSPHAGDAKERKFYFADLPGELQNVLRVQLHQPGDVSAVIEMPTGFLLYVAKEKTDEALSVAGLSLPKRSYEQWLEEQTEGTK
ncbi:MAG: hypothetical protein HY301_18045 [Verrucomicrobia bacterium]|nr:hypothetical protein [Verrucomicrobiota bacterium]